MHAEVKRARRVLHNVDMPSCVLPELLKDSVCNVQPLRDANAWPYVAKWQDAYFVHSAGFTDQGAPADLLRSLIATMEPHQGRFAAELGGGTEPDDNWPQGQVNLWGGWAASIEPLGLAWTECTHDFQTHCDKFCEVCDMVC